MSGIYLCRRRIRLLNKAQKNRHNANKHEKPAYPFRYPVLPMRLFSFTVFPSIHGFHPLSPVFCLFQCTIFRQQLQSRILFLTDFPSDSGILAVLWGRASVAAAPPGTANRFHQRFPNLPHSPSLSHALPESAISTRSAVQFRSNYCTLTNHPARFRTGLKCQASFLLLSQCRS